MRKINHKRKRMEETVSVVVDGKLPSSSGKGEEDPTHLNYTHPPFSGLITHPLQKLRPIRSPYSADTTLQQLGFSPPPPQEAPQQQVEMSAEMLMKMKAEMDASFINSFRSQLSNLPLSLTSSSSSESSDDSIRNTGEDMDPPSTGNGNGNGNDRKTKKRKKFESFLETLMSRVIHKQEQMHQQLLDLIETKERDRISREQEWRRIEMDRVHRDQELRSQVAARSLALISYIQTALGAHHTPTPTPAPAPLQAAAFLSPQQAKTDHDPNYKRWPTSEVQALITLRAAHDHKFNTQATKASVWEEISNGMASMGFNRNARKCKEKWENINKYYKKAASSGKQPSENAKSCPYFHELETLYTNQLITNGKPSSPRRDNVEEIGKL